MLFSPFLVCEICGTRAKEQFCLPSQTTSVNRHHPAAGNWRFSVILHIKIFQDGSCVCFHMSPRVLQRTFKVRWSPKPSSNAPPPAPGSDRAKARPRAGSAGSLRRLPQLPVFATVRSRRFRSRAAQPPKQKRLSRGLQLRQTGCPRGHVGRRRVT